MLLKLRMSRWTVLFSSVIPQGRNEVYFLPPDPTVRP